MVPQMRPAFRRVHPCFSIGHRRDGRHVRATNVSFHFMLRCSILAMGVAVTRITEGMIGLTNELHGVDTGPPKSDILRVANQTHSACDLCDQSKQDLYL
jgi:hypothetical protein